jgi:kumamolisin
VMPLAVVLGESVAYTQMALQGQSAFVSSGDEGAFGCTRFDPSDHSLQLEDPSSQPFVTAVGGTSFAGTFDPGKNPHPKYPGNAKEHVWNVGCSSSGCTGPGVGATGGGVSRIWASPPYQVGPGVNESGFSQSGSYCGQVAGVPCREVPDVSLVADPNSGFAEYCTDPGCTPDGGPGWFPIGGTSLSSPLWSAIAALMDHHQHGRLGLFNLFLYEDLKSASYHVKFHDITIGDNGFYPAGQFYDMSTGIGTTDIYKLVK